jgi:hypothetical protein
LNKIRQGKERWKVKDLAGQTEDGETRARPKPRVKKQNYNRFLRRTNGKTKRAFADFDSMGEHAKQMFKWLEDESNNAVP